MRTRIAAALAALLFTLGAVAQIWIPTTGVTMMLLGIAMAVAAAVLMQQNIQRRLMKNERFILNLQRSVTSGNEISLETRDFVTDDLTRNIASGTEKTLHAIGEESTATRTSITSDVNSITELHEATAVRAERSIEVNATEAQRTLTDARSEIAELHNKVLAGNADVRRYGGSIFRRVLVLAAEHKARASLANAEPSSPNAGTTELDDTGTSSTATPNELIETSPPSAKVLSREATRAPSPPRASGSTAQVDLENLQNNFRLEPTARNLEKLVGHMWNTLGEITRPATLVHMYGDLVTQFPHPAALLAKQIEDAADLLAELPQIPPRSDGAMVQPVPNRVLYCVHATPMFHTNGYAVRTRGIAQGLKAQGRDVRVVGRPGYPWDVKVPGKPERVRHFRVESGVGYAHLPVLGLDELPKGAYIKAAADALVREALDFRPAVIQAASNSQNALIGLIAARRLGLPFVYEVRGLWEVTQASNRELWAESERYELDVALENLVTREADSVSVITRQLGDELVRRGAEDARITVVPNAVDIDAILPLPKDPTHEVVPGLTGVPLVGFAGSLVAYEGLDLLIDAIGRLNAQGTTCHLVIAGSGAHESALKQHTRDSGLEDVVHFLGRIPHDDVRQVLASLDVVVCPRTSNRVTEMVSPIKPLEAFAAGRVVLMSDVAPQHDLASGGTVAPLFRSDDLPSLTDELQRLVESSDTRRGYERRARLWVRDHRTWRGVCAPLVQAHASAHKAHTSTLAAREHTQELSRITIAVAGPLPSDLGISESCQLVSLVPDSSQWRASLQNGGINLVVAATCDRESWNAEALTDLFQDAAAAGVPTMLITDQLEAQGHSWAQLTRFADHIAIGGGAPVDADVYATAVHSTTVTRISPAIDPKVASPLAAAPRRNTIAALADSVPPGQVLDLVRAHGLRLLTVQGEEPPNLPSRFASLYEEHEDLAGATKSAAASVAVIRSPSSLAPRASLGVGAHGGIEVSVDSDTDLDALDERLTTLMTDADEWSRGAWEAVRHTYRSNTVQVALALLLRTAGIPVDFRAHPTYAVTVQLGQEERLRQIIAQTVPPTSVVVPDELHISSEMAAGAEARGIEIVQEVPGDVALLGDAMAEMSPTFYEDLLIASTFADVHEIRTVPASSDTQSLASLVPAAGSHGQVALRRINASDVTNSENVLLIHQAAYRSKSTDATFSLPVIDKITSTTQETSTSSTPTAELVLPFRPSPKILIAGHDLKFIGEIARSLEAAGAEVFYDNWRFHNSHDEKQSFAHLAGADTIFCEWGLGNAVWYSHHKLPGQRLLVRVHSQEIRTAHLRKINHRAVDCYIFVNEIVRSAAIAFHGIPESKTTLIPNGVSVETLWRPKGPGSEKTIGFVGVVPQQKRLDLALDVLERVRESDPEYRLAIKGKGPEDYPWMTKRATELEWYERQYSRIAEMNAERPGTVRTDGHGNDMPEWYSGVGVVLSTSDFESFHFTIGDGVASGSRPAVLYWPGADGIYPRRWLSDSIDAVADSILDGVANPADREYVANRFSVRAVSSRLKTLLMGDSQLPEFHERATSEGSPR